MPNLLQRGASWLGGKQQTAAGRTVTYRRAAGGTSSVTAWPDSHVEETDERGLETSMRIYNWTVVAGDLAADPVEMDQIEETLNGASVAWQVCPAAPGKPCFRWADTAQTLYIVSTKQVAA